MRSLDDVAIAKPCSARWEDMKGDDRVRRCDQCQLSVFNLAAMTRADAEALVARTEGEPRPCLRLYRRLDGTVLTQDCPRGVLAIVHRQMRIAAFWFLALFGLSALVTGVAVHVARPRFKLGQGLMQ